MNQTVIQKHAWNEDFWQNPWDQGGLIVICVFIATVLFLILLATVFGLVDQLEMDRCEEE
ncbi:small integral membrane protein 6 [Tupaia chinensis]|uniref:small integral membrane protein 6 n=1 Tax=Tupaia chinensis TaxID=246437 RepID=UPI0003C91EF3|nr:small integral membrane protein 6 [Tupaia chinensis]XP_006145872.1 small integral membrane protein 6 [Tupaia chinensis]